MTLDKSHAAVGCAHCQGKGAEALCRSCRSLICRACLSRGDCPRVQPSMRRLEVGTALYEIDTSGRAGLCRRGLRELSAVDLETGLQTFLGVRVAAANAPHSALPRLVTRPSGVIEVLACGAPGVIERVAVSGATAQQLPLARRASDSVTALRPDHDGTMLAVLHRSGALERIDLKSETARLVAAVTPGALIAAGAELVVAAEPDATRVFDTERGEELWRLERPAAGPARWLGLAGAHLVTLRGHSAGGAFGDELAPLVLEHRVRRDFDGAFELAGTITLPQPAPVSRRRRRRRRARRARERANSTPVASLGRDGRFVIALGHKLALYRLPAPAPTWLAVADEAEPIEVTALRFEEPSRALLSADNTGRVIRWPDG